MGHGSVRWPRTVAAVLLGTSTAVVLALVSVIVLLLARIGIPLGAEAWHPSMTEHLALLALVGGAAALGGYLSARTAGRGAPVALAFQSVLLGAGAIWGFSDPASQWPDWWSPAVAAVLFVGTWTGSWHQVSRYR